MGYEYSHTIFPLEGRVVRAGRRSGVLCGSLIFVWLPAPTVLGADLSMVFAVDRPADLDRSTLKVALGPMVYSGASSNGWR